MFDVSKLTLDEVGAEIDKAIDKLQRLQALYSAMLQQDNKRIAKLIAEYKAAAKQQEGQDDVQHADPDSLSP